MANATPKKCGYVALIGLPNAGKSTLFNACVGQKLSGVSAKRQTTRTQILGVTLHKNCQVLFLDTPGIHKISNPTLMNKRMNAAAHSSASDADLIVYCIDVSKGWLKADGQLLQPYLENGGKNLVIALTKVDKIKKNLVKECFNSVARTLKESLPENCAEEVPILQVSAKRKETLADLLSHISKYMPESEWLYGEDEVTNISQKQIAAEYIREQIYRQFSQEIPYGCSVQIEQFHPYDDHLEIDAKIMVSKDSIKPMIIGKGGKSIGRIREASTEALERFFEQPVSLKLFVKVEKNWQNDSTILEEVEFLNH